jgi:hypothetical protein
MNKPSRWPSVRTAALIAGTLAVLAFGEVTYHPQFGLLTNIMIDKIEFTRGCVPSPSPCGFYITYKWALSVLGVFVGVVALRQRKKSAS